MPASRTRSFIPLVIAVLGCGAACDPSEFEADTDGQGLETSGSTGLETTGADECTVLVQEAIEGSVHLEPGCYRVPDPLFIEGRLDIHAGAELTFHPGAGVTVLAGGVLSAIGSEDAPVLMDGLPGDTWAGLVFSGAASSENRLETVVLLQAEGDAVRVELGSRLDVLGARIEGAPGVGLAVDAGSTVNVEGTRFSSNGIPLSVPLSGVVNIAGDNEYVANVESVIQVAGGTLEASATWQTPGAPLQFTSDVRLEAALQLSAGTELRMPQGSDFSVRAGGSLRAEGTPANPIRWRGVLAERGYWGALAIESNTADNVLAHCVVEDGGMLGSEAMVVVEDQGRVNIHDSTLRNSASAALAAEPDANITGFENNTLTGNLVPMALATQTVQQLGPGNTMTGNDEDLVRVGTNLNSTIETAGTWRALDVPYRVVYEFEVRDAWTLEPGVVLEFGQDQWLTLDELGSMVASGTPQDPIVFRGAEPVSGYWRGLEVLSLAENVLEHFELRHGGSSNFNGGSDADGMLYLEDGRITIRNGVIADSAGWGISMWNESVVLECSNVAFEANAKGPLFQENDDSTSACG